MGRKCEKAFKETKRPITSGELFTHGDPSLLITLASDASLYGIDEKPYTNKDQTL